MLKSDRSGEKGWLLVIPAVYLLLQLLLKADYRYFFLSAHDPAYGYLFNGLDLAEGNMKLGLFAHPGAPLHILVAVNLFIAKLIQGQASFPLQVFLHSETYLQVISVELVLLNTITLLWIGLRICRRTGNPAIALALQLSPFVSVQGFAFGSLVMLEPLLLFAELNLLVLLAAYAFGERFEFKGKALVSISIWVAFGLSAKVVFLPVFLLPFFMIDGIRRKAIYVGLTVLASAILLFPLYAVIPSFWHWIRNLFIHTGQYGSGSTGIIDLAAFVTNLGRIFLANGWFTGTFAVMTGTVFLTAHPRYRGRQDSRKVRVLRGLFVVFILNILMVAKHFSVHYMIISQNLTMIGFLVSLAVIRDSLYPQFQLRKSMELLLVVAGAACLTGWAITSVGYSHRLKNPRLESLAWTDNPLPRIIVLESPGPFRETALYHGMSFSGDMKGSYSVILRKLYPATFFYYPGEDRLVDWSHEVNLISLLSRFPEIRLWYTSRKDTLPGSLAASFKALRTQGRIRSVKILDSNPVTSEYLYRIESDTARSAAAIMSFPEEFTEFEPIRLSHDNPFGANIKFILKRGYYELNVLRKSPDNKGALVVTGVEGQAFYRSAESPVITQDGWDHLTLVLNVTPEMEGREALLYVWYPGRKECIFRELRVTRYEIR